ncbi:MAG: hypothetical protein QNL04_10975 [SAR324 cluster bacterium]|nr:hypothetical protein [SAR324 cluster bacterium]
MDVHQVLKQWSQAQVIWYIEVVIHAIDADGVVAPIEMEYLSNLFVHVEDSTMRMRLRMIIEDSERPSIKSPPEISKKGLAWAFTEIAALMIADFDFDQKEQAFLQELATLMGLNEKFIPYLIKWALQGHAWQQSRIALLEVKPDEDGNYSLQVPLMSFDTEQRLWYAQILVNSIVIDGKIDNDEIEMFKGVLGFVEDNLQKENLLKHVKRKVRPTLYAPKGIDESVLKLVLFEVLTHFVMQNQMHDKEKIFIRQLGNILLLPDDLTEKAILWWSEGVNWRRKVPALIHNAQ